LGATRDRCRTGARRDYSPNSRDPDPGQPQGPGLRARLGRPSVKGDCNAGGAYARVVGVAVAAAPRYRASRPVGRGHGHRTTDQSIQAAVGAASPGTPYSSSQAATPSRELPARPIRRCHAGPDRQGRHQPDRPDAGRRQAGCPPVDAAPLKCAVCGTIVSWPNRKAAASQTCPVRWPISRPLDARTGRSVPLAHDEPASTGSAYSAFGAPGMGFSVVL
jgi:hypothetical protein